MANSGSSTGNAGTDIFGTSVSTPNTGGQNLLGNLLASVDPQLASAQTQYNLGQEQQGLINPELQSQLSYNNAMAGYQQGQAGLSAQGIGIQQTGLAQQGQQATTQQGLEQQQYALQSGQYPEQQAAATTAYQGALMNQQGQQNISGSKFTVGGQQQTGALQQQYGFQLADIARSQALAGLGQQSEQSGYQYSQEQLQNASQNLQLNAQANGLSQQQILNSLGYQNQQAGLGAVSQYQQGQAGLQQDVIGMLATAGPALSQAGFAQGFNAVAGTGG